MVLSRIKTGSIDKGQLSPVSQGNAKRMQSKLHILSKSGSQTSHSLNLTHCMLTNNCGCSSWHSAAAPIVRRVISAKESSLVKAPDYSNA